MITVSTDIVVTVAISDQFEAETGIFVENGQSKSNTKLTIKGVNLKTVHDQLLAASAVFLDAANQVQDRMGG